MIYKIFLPYQDKPCYIQTTEFEIIDFIVNYYGEYCQAAEFCNGFLIKVDKNGFEFRIETKDGICRTVYPQNPIIDIVHRVGGTSSKYILLHGIAIANHGSAHLFLAHTNSGKSTLAAMLLYRNYQVLTDDVVVIEKQTGLLIPVITPIRLRDGGKRILLREIKQSISFANMTIGEEERFLIAPTKSVNANYPIKSIMFSRFGTNNCCRHLESYAEILATLMGSSMNSQVFTPEDISAFRTLTKIDSYYIEYTNTSYVDCWLKKNSDDLSSKL